MSTPLPFISGKLNNCGKSFSVTFSLLLTHRSAGSRMEVRSERERNTKLLHKVVNTSSSSTSLCLKMRLNMNVMQKPPNPPACSLS